MKLVKSYIFFFLLLVLLASPVEASDFVIIVNNDNPVSSLSKSEIKKIFLGKKTFWPDGEGIVALFLDGGEVHRSFVYEVLNKSPHQLSMYWKLALFSGTGLPPKQLPDSKSVKEAVATNPQAIGYIDINHLDGSVRQVEFH